MDISKPIIICGSGNSVPFNDDIYKIIGCGLPDKLKHIIENNYSIGLNYWFQFGCETTFNSSGDWQFYIDNTEELKKLPLIIASEDPSLKNKNIDRTHENTILLPDAGTYHGINSWSEGFYHRQLVGMLGLTIAIAFGFKEIYLLGYDCMELEGKTHFYQNVADLTKITPLYLNGVLKENRLHFRGIGKNPKEEYKTSSYNYIKQINNKWYAPFHAERKKIRIYNVSTMSKINTFEKISYGTFFQQVDSNNIDQNKVREEVKTFIVDNLVKK